MHAIKIAIERFTNIKIKESNFKIFVMFYIVLPL